MTNEEQNIGGASVDRETECFCGTVLEAGLCPNGHDPVTRSLVTEARIAEAARDFIWEPENWEAYQDSKTSNSVAWPPEFLLLAQAVEERYGPMPVDAEEPLCLSISDQPAHGQAYETKD
jgi:hypothetical protein